MLIKNVYIENAQETKDIRIRDGVFSEIAAGLTPEAGVTRYEILYKASLDDASWVSVSTGTVTLDGVQPDKVSQVSAQDVNAAQGFFRVRLTK